MGLSFVRTIALYISVIIAMRIMGKRTIGEMHPTEMVVSIMISDLATVPMQSKSTPLSDGIVPIFTLVVLELVFAFLVLKSRSIRRLLVGRSCSVTKGGKLLEKEMANLKITVDDIEEQIRINGYTSLKDVEEIVVETNGQVSVIGKKEAEKVPYLVVADGKIRKKDMQRAHITAKDIENELKKQGIADVNEVLYMSAIDSKIVHMQKRGEK
ncbi:MAG: DUF421 domain-containing protein [Clostridia bacterium]|nr:DUF421 domain-containing protein [Clostridia bacterium]